MASHESDEFAHGALELARHRREQQTSMRSALGAPAYGGVGYGLSAYGSSSGAVTGVQQQPAGGQPAPAPGSDTTPPVSPDQFGGITTPAPAGDSGTSGGVAAGTGGAAA